MGLLTKLAVATFALTMTTSLASAQVVVSSKIDTEGGLLGNIISQVLQANDVPVTEKIQLGATSVVSFLRASTSWPSDRVWRRGTAWRSVT